MNKQQLKTWLTSYTNLYFNQPCLDDLSVKQMDIDICFAPHTSPNFDSLSVKSSDHADKPSWVDPDIKYQKTIDSAANNPRQKPLLMGILNVTPDSFYAKNRYLNLDTAYARAMQMIEDGVDIIDIGGESTKPFTKPTSCTDELQRTIPLIELLRKNSDVCISIDTYKQQVMEAAVNAGADLINDITGLGNIDNILDIQKLDVPIILTHIQGHPESMQINPSYPNGVLETINAYFSAKINFCLQAGIKIQNIIIDPGFGFGKTTAHNIEILQNLHKLAKHKVPIMLGLSRKSTIGEILNKPVDERLIGSIAATCFSIMQGASIIRAHDINETKQAMDLLNSLLNGI